MKNLNEANSNSSYFDLDPIAMNAELRNGFAIAFFFTLCLIIVIYPVLIHYKLLFEVSLCMWLLPASCVCLFTYVAMKVCR